MTNRKALCLGVLFALIAAVTGALVGCGGDGSSSAAAAPLSCDDSMKTAFKPDANTTVEVVKALKAGDTIALAAPSAPASAPDDMCVVKLLVGPGHAGPAGAPSTTPGIGIEVWLPTKAQWNKRIHLIGGTGMAGGPQATLTTYAAGGGVNPWDVAGTEHAVSATTDTGHPDSSGNFLMNPDGTMNTVGWDEFARRGIHEMTLKAKVLTQAYYGSAAKYTYWHGGSTGGRQGLMQAQAYPEDFDGIIASSPAINWSRFTTSMLYGQLAMQRDLAGAGMSAEQVNAVSAAALNSCDLVGGQHLGFLLDPGQCRYDPTKDASVLCVSSGGSNTTAACVSTAQATVLNKAWYGQMRDGTVPDPATDNGYGALDSTHLWYGYPRGSDVATEPFPGFGTIVGAVSPRTIATDLVALELQDSTLATPSFINATGNGEDGWKSLTYAQLARASDRGVTLQSYFGNIDTDNPDLSKFKARGGKLITMYGTSDPVIPYLGITNYYDRVVTQMGGVANVQGFYKLYLVAGMGHLPSNGTVNPDANPPIPTESLKYSMLTDWVEKSVEPSQVSISSAATQTAVAKSQLMCVYPAKTTYVSGDIMAATSYSCQ